MEPDEVAWAVSEGCIMACCMSWTLAGSMRIAADCMASVESGVFVARGVDVTDQISDHVRSTVASLRRRGSRNARFSARVETGYARHQVAFERACPPGLASLHA